MGASSAGASSRGDRGAAQRLGHRVLLVLGTLAGIALSWIALTWLTLPAVSGYADSWPDRTAYMRIRIAEAARRGEELELRYRPVPLSQVPQALRRAVLVSEDAAFFDHSGFDWFELRAALDKAWREREVPRGASTITQQLARNLYLSPRRDPSRKLREALITRRLERRLTKNRILELYLSVIELGQGVFGVDAAARHYFGVAVSGISAHQAAMLAATIPSPLRDNPATDTRRFRWRTGLIAGRAF
ncbi:MAG: monofunctional biosynthetic peptidoglycan transglycosylase [Gemmatimonadota bacterium]|nr:MAG: monofunctional biosynthetic peptidoglycan transglycosylase [Gemmatimonadota bacterium]